jgi:hypothetical protein
LKEGGGWLLLKKRKRCTPGRAIGALFLIVNSSQTKNIPASPMSYALKLRSIYRGFIIWVIANLLTHQAIV